MGQENDARLLYYHRQPRDRKHVVQLVRESSAFVGIKVVQTKVKLLDFVRKLGIMVLWGWGDRPTAAARWVPAATLPVYPYFLPKRVT